MKKVGDNIKTLRKSLKLTQEEFAKKAKISRSYLGDLENNRRNPSTETIKKLSKNTGISTSFLINGITTYGDEYVLGDNYFDESTPQYSDEQVEYIEKMVAKAATNVLTSLDEVNFENYDKFEILNFETTLNLINTEKDKDNPVSKRKIAQLSLALASEVNRILNPIDPDEENIHYYIREYFKIQEQLTELIKEYR